MRRFVSVFLLLSVSVGLAHPPLEPGDPESLYYEVLASRAIKDAEGVEPPSDEDVPYHTLNYSIELELDPGGSPLITNGEVTLIMQSDQDDLEEIVLDLVDLTVDSVTQDGDACTYTHSAGLLTIDLETLLEDGEVTAINIYYHGTPTDGLWYNAGANGGIVYTCGCPDVTRNWFPCRDWNFEKAQAAVSIIIDSDYMVTSNGQLVSDEPYGGGHRVVFQARDPIAPYLIMFSASDYEYYRDYFYGANTVPIDYYIYQGRLDDAHAEFDYVVPECMGVFENLFGDYPFERAGYNMSPLPYGGMEHQTCITLLASLVNGTGNYYDIWVHEMAHQWFGDAVTAHTWKECWLNEGFATYCEVVYDEDQDGEAGRLSRLQEHRNKYDIGDNNNRSPIYDPDPLFGYLPYYKGSWVLNMLRRLLGDADFYACLADYFADNLYATGTTFVLRDNFEDFWDGNSQHSDSDLDWFFDQWVFQAGHPEFEWQWWTTGSGSNTELHLQIDQVQSTAEDTPYVFETPIDFGVDYAGRQDEVVTVWMDQRSQEFTVELDDEVAAVELDPGFWLLCDEEDVTGVEHLEATVDGGDEGLLVDWSADADCLGVELYRLAGPAETRLHESLLPATGAFLDRNLPGAGAYRYRIVAHAADGESVELLTASVPWRSGVEPTALAAPWPCPARGPVNIEFSLAAADEVELAVYDTAGRRLTTLCAGEMSAGRHSIAWDAQAPPGVYLLRLESAGTVLTRRLVVER
ncbi:MAG: T9SS type A sorting domain-containing protein [Candidatus Coatesbacteria bacterium]|nr:T9SS type A sorting domain-containing protein [Candidatus Coatesbacteria bacterium]